MESLFVFLSHAVTGAPALALGAALAWGVLSILLSPCHLASIPLIVAFINGRGTVGTRRALVVSTLFALGILASIAVIGALTAVAGRMLGDLGAWGNWLVAAIFFLIGLHLLGFIPRLWSMPDQGRLFGGHGRSALLLGLVFGIALGPCTFAFMAPVLAVAFSKAGESPLWGASLLVAYGIGHCVVIVLAGTFTEVIQHYLDWNARSRGAMSLRKICGLLVIAGGGWLIYAAP